MSPHPLEIPSGSLPPDPGPGPGPMPVPPPAAAQHGDGDDPRAPATDLPTPATTSLPAPEDAGFLEDAAMERRIRELPREVGVMLLSVGTLGMVLPGIMGTPAVLAGGLVLWPKAFGRLETWFERRYPKLHHQSMKQIGRYLGDLEKRFPPDRPPR